jgi:hypothetical protein
MASVKIDNGPNGMRNDFEAAAAYLLPYDPVAKKRAVGGKRSGADISSIDADVEEVSSTTMKKQSMGKTGVHLRYHKISEYKALTDEQRDELREWRSRNPKESSKSNKKTKAEPMLKSKTFTKKQVAALVTKQVEAELKKSVECDEDKKAEAVILSMVEAAVAKSLKKEPETQKVSLKSILKRSKE